LAGKIPSPPSFPTPSLPPLSSMTLLGHYPIRI
jgi:hypothetical protein